MPTARPIWDASTIICEQPLLHVTWPPASVQTIVCLHMWHQRAPSQGWQPSISREDHGLWHLDRPNKPLTPGLRQICERVS